MLATKATIAPATTRVRCCRALASHFRYPRASGASKGLSLCVTGRVNMSVASTGITMSATTSEANIAKQMDSAIGANIFPSTPSSVNRGVNTMRMISTAKVTGLATSRAASVIKSATPCPSRARSRCLKMFSTMTTEPSTIMPMAMASPPRLIRFAEMPSCSITASAASTDTGTEISTSAAARRFIRNRNSTMTISANASSNAFSTVHTALAIRSD